MHTDTRVLTKSLLSLAVAAACCARLSVAEAQNVEEILVFGTQAAQESSTASRLDLTLLQTPATVDVIDGDAIRARVETSVLDAVTRSAGFTTEANPGNGHSSISARGFTGQGAVTKLYDGVNYYNAAGTMTFPFDTWAVERIEILKGPASVMYGEGGIGGAINIIPRRPEADGGGDVRLTAGGNSTAFLGVGYTDGTDTLAYRIDYSKLQSDNWVNNGDSDSEALALSLLWNVSDDLVLEARYDAGEQSPMKYFGIPVENGDFVRDFVDLNFNVSDAEISYKDDALRLKADWQVSDDVSVAAVIYHLNTERHWKNTEWPIYDPDTRTIGRFDWLQLGHDMTHDGLRASVSFKPSASRVSATVGVEINDVSFERPTNYGPGNPNGLTFDEFDEVDPYNFRPGAYANVIASPYLPDQFVSLDQQALFGEVHFEVTDDFALVGALRYDDYATDGRRVGAVPFSQDVDAFTGRIGAVYDISDETALYAQYVTGAQHNISVITISSAWREASMIDSEQLEIGIKHQVEGTGLSLNAALFDITKKNLVEDNPNSANPDDLLLVPKQTSQGIEVGLNYAVSDAVQVYANGTVLNAEGADGATPNAVPEQTYNFGVAWSVGEVRLLADARYVGSRPLDGTDAPSYTVLDASAYWAMNDDLGLTLKVDNLTDELFASAAYNGNWLVGKPRTVSLSLDFRF